MKADALREEADWKIAELDKAAEEQKNVQEEAGKTKDLAILQGQASIASRSASKFHPDMISDKSSRAAY